MSKSSSLYVANVVTKGLFWSVDIKGSLCLNFLVLMETFCVCVEHLLFDDVCLKQ